MGCKGETQMTISDRPALGRRIKRLFHEDRPALIRLLSLAPHDRWIIYARAWLMAMDDPPADIERVIPGILFVWSQLVREYNAATHHNTDRIGKAGRTPRARE